MAFDRQETYGPRGWLWAHRVATMRQAKQLWSFSLFLALSALSGCVRSDGGGERYIYVRFAFHDGFVEHCSAFRDGPLSFLVNKVYAGRIQGERIELSSRRLNHLSGGSIDELLAENRYEIVAVGGRDGRLIVDRKLFASWTGEKVAIISLNADGSLSLSWDAASGQ